MFIIRNIVVLLALILLIPIMLLLIIFIIVEDGAPAIFVQERVGIHKNVFKLFKLRTMKNNTIQAGTHDVDKSNILWTGKAIRKFKLDEFLQLINVINGDLNLVGPRPSLANQLELIAERETLDVFSIKPGITGLAQICGYDMSDPKTLAAVDSIYIKNQSHKLDFMILISTFTGIFKKRLKRKFNI